MNRRQFLRTAAVAGSLFAAPYDRLAAALKKKIRITDVKCMIVRGTWDWNLIKIETDSGLYGIGEAYWGWGVKDLVLNKMKGIIVGEDPLNVDKLYTKMLMQSAGAGAIGGVTVTAASGIEIALWDLCGRILETPVCNLLGGRFRDRIRFYKTTQAVDNVEDLGAWRAQVAEMKAEKWGWTALKFQGDGIPPRSDPQFPRARPRPLRPQPSPRRTIAASSPPWRPCATPSAPISTSALSATGTTTLRTSSASAASSSTSTPPGSKTPCRRKTSMPAPVSPSRSAIPVLTGENLYGRHGFRKLIEQQATSGVHIDIPKSGGLLESKKISDMAELYYIWTACHNPASPLGTIASCRRLGRHARLPSARTRQVGALVARPGRPRGPILDQRLLHHRRQTGLRRRNQPRCRQSAPGARRNLVGLTETP